jgi:hypothetical protein
VKRWCAALLVAAACRKPTPPEPATQQGIVVLPPAPVKVKLPRLDPAASVVSVECGESRGTGFFVSETQVLTRASFLCEGDEALRLKLSDERTLLGKVKWKDEGLNAAVIEAQGGEGYPLPLGDASAVAFNGMLSKGKLLDDAYSELARFHFVVEGTLAEGSPVLDEDGRAVAMAARALDENRVLALPLPVLVGSGIKAPSPRWSEVEARARPVAEAELRSAGEALSRAMLATAVLDAEGALFALVLRRDATAASLTLSVGDCRVEVQGVPWVPFDEGAALDLPSRRLFKYLGRSRLDDPLVMAQLRLEGCPTRPGDKVRLGDQGTYFEQAAVGRVTRTLQGTHSMVAVPAAPVAEERSDEALWRRRYAEAHKRVADVERELEEERHFIHQSDRRGSDPRMPWRLTPAEIERYDAAKTKLARADELRAQARAALDELDRQAANAAVPLEWRR